jgi:hypothetical protein
MASCISFIPIILNSRSSKDGPPLWTSRDSPVLPPTSRMEKAVRATAWAPRCFGHNRDSGRFSVDKATVRENLSPDLPELRRGHSEIARKIRPGPDIRVQKYAQPHIGKSARKNRSASGRYRYRARAWA